MLRMGVVKYPSGRLSCRCGWTGGQVRWPELWASSFLVFRVLPVHAPKLSYPFSEWRRASVGGGTFEKYFTPCQTVTRKDAKKTILRFGTAVAWSFVIPVSVI